IQQQPSLIQFLTAQRHPHLVVVPVRILALAPIVAKIVSGGEPALHGNFIHQRSRPCGGQITPPDSMRVSRALELCRVPQNSPAFGTAYTAGKLANRGFVTRARLQPGALATQKWSWLL